MKVLVTGGTGFTGSHLCERLWSEGYSVRALVRDYEHANELRLFGAELAVGDLRDFESLRQAVDGVDLVYNIAASYRKANLTRKEVWDTNVFGTKNMLEVAIQAGVKRFVHCSTVGVHGHIENPPANGEFTLCSGRLLSSIKVRRRAYSVQVYE